MMAMQPATNEYNAGFRGNTHSSGAYTQPVPVTNETEQNKQEFLDKNIDETRS